MNYDSEFRLADFAFGNARQPGVSTVKMINLSSFIAYHARRTPERCALKYRGREISYSAFDTRIRKTVRYAEAPVKGSSVLKYDPKGPAADAYRDLAKEVLNGAKARKHA